MYQELLGLTDSDFVGIDEAHLRAVCAVLEGILAPGRARKWLRGSNVHLDNRTPLFLLRRGEVDLVLGAARMLKSGGYG